MVTDLSPQSGPLLSLPLLFAGLVLWLALLAGTIHFRRRWTWLLPEFVALSGLLLAQLLFFWRPLLTSTQVPNGGGDLVSFYFPLQAFAAAQIQHGHFPLWNPYLHAGMPQFANFQTAMLYPPNLIVWLLIRPFTYQTLELLVIAHYLLASIGTYLLARSLGQRRHAALLAGIVFAYSGFLVAHLGHYTMLATAAWLPWLLLVVRHLALKRSWLWAFATGCVVFLATTAGHQQALLFDLTVAGLWWLFWIGEREDFWSGGLERDWDAVLRRMLRPFVTNALRAIAALAFGLLLAAPVVLPSLQLSQLSVRTQLSYEQSTEFSAEPIALLQFVLPKAFGSNPMDYWGPFSNGEVWGYAGVVTLVLVALALALRPSRLRLFLGALAAIALCYALGPFTPVQGWVFRFAPLYNLVRAPARAFLFVDLSLALLAGFGTQELSGCLRSDPRRRAIVRSASRALLIIISALVFFALPLIYSLVIGASDPLNRPMIVIDGVYLLIFYLAGTLVLLWAVASGRLRGAAIGLLALSLVTLDLFGANASFNPVSADLTAGFRHPEAVSFLQAKQQSDGPFRIDVATVAWQPDLATLAGLYDIGGTFDPMQLKSYDQARSAVAGNRNLHLYDLLGTRYLITDANAVAPGPEFTPALKTGDGLMLWENTEALPRVWLPPKVQPMSLDDARAAIREPSFDPRGEVYLSGGDAPKISGSGSARITEYDPDVVRIRVDANGPAVLVLADVNYRGWTASVDGRSTPVATADGLFRAVTVPAGTHEVVFRFRPPLLFASIALSLLGVLLGAAMLGYGLYRRHLWATDSA